MIRIGDYNRLEVTSVGKEGATASDGTHDILIPVNQCDETVLTGAVLSLFVYRNSNDNVIATTKKPKGVVGDFVALTVVDDTEIGAFLDWGLDKDIFVPHSQMLGKMLKGKTYVVRIITDTISNRIIASPRLRPFLKKPDPQNLPEGTKISAMIYENRDLGVMAIVNNEYVAMFSQTEFKTAQMAGSVIEAYVKKYDEEGRLTISRAPVGRAGWNDAESKMVQLLNENDGFLPINDKSSPIEISRRTGMSKKSFKKIVGGLLKAKRLEITDGGIRLVD